jgi:hypothetical protein
MIYAKRQKNLDYGLLSVGFVSVGALVESIAVLSKNLGRTADKEKNSLQAYRLKAPLRVLSENILHRHGYAFSAEATFLFIIYSSVASTFACMSTTGLQFCGPQDFSINR